MRNFHSLAFLFLLMIPVLAPSQVKVYTNENERIKEIESPMTLEITLGDLLSQGDGKEAETTTLQRYSCFGVVVEKLSVIAKEKEKTNEVILKGSVLLRNIGHEDSYTSVNYALVKAERIIATCTDKRFKTEEDETRTRFFRLTAAKSDLRELKQCVLRLTIAVIPE